jgi:hypothetical protein
MQLSDGSGYKEIDAWTCSNHHWINSHASLLYRRSRFYRWLHYQARKQRPNVLVLPAMQFLVFLRLIRGLVGSRKLQE